MALFKKSEKLLVKSIKYLGVDDAVSDNLKLKSILADLNLGFDSDTTIILLFQEKGFALRVLSNLTHPSKISEKKILKEFKQISGYSDKQCTWVFSVWNNALSKADYPVSLKTYIKYFKAIDFKNEILSGDEITIVWDVLNYSKINLIINNTEIIDITNEHSYKLNPKQNTSLHLEIDNVNFSIPTKSNTISVKVLKRITLSLYSDRKFTIQGLPIKINWDSQNATDISIHSNIGDSFDGLSKKGEIEIFPSKDCIYTIVAKHDLDYIEKKKYFYVKEIPSIKNLKIPKIPTLTPNFSLNSNYQLESDTSFNPNIKNIASIEKVIKSYSNMFNLISDSINSNNIIEKINTFIYDKKNTK